MKRRFWAWVIGFAERQLRKGRLCIICIRPLDSVPFIGRKCLDCHYATRPSRQREPWE